MIGLLKMELTLESAFSPGGMVGHFSYLLLVISMMMRNISLLRILVIASAFVGIVYDWFWLRDPVGVFWESSLVVVNLVQLALLYWKNVTARFDVDEMSFLKGRLPGLSKGKSRQLLDLGRWTTLANHEVLTKEGEPVDALYYLATGSVDIYAAGKRVSQCRAGSFIGEMSVIDAIPASATTIVVSAARIWRIDADVFRRVLQKHPEIEREIEASFSRNFKEKLIATNLLIADGKVP